MSVLLHIVWEVYPFYSRFLICCRIYRILSVHWGTLWFFFIFNYYEQSCEHLFKCGHTVLFLLHIYLWVKWLGDLFNLLTFNTTSQLHQQCVRVLSSPYTHQYWLLFPFVLAILVSVKWDFTVVFTCLSLCWGSFHVFSKSVCSDPLSIL